MSGIVIIFPAMIFISFGVAFWAGRFVSGRIGLHKSWHRWMASFLVGAIVLATGVFCTIQFASDKYKFGVLPNDVPLKLPKDASDVDYRWSWGDVDIRLIFTLARPDF